MVQVVMFPRFARTSSVKLRYVVKVLDGSAPWQFRTFLLVW